MYELMIVATTGGSESLISRVEKLVKDAEGANIKVGKLGKKQLAYPIKKQTEAEYFLLEFEAEGPNLKSITDKLRLEQEDLLRYMLLGKKEKRLSKKGKKVEVAQKEESKKETAKVTVVTKKVSEVSKVSKVTKVKKESKVVDAKAKSKVASGAKVKSKGKSKK